MAGYIKDSNGNYTVNYEDEQLVNIQNEQAQKENQLNDTYNNILENSDKYYKDQIQATQDYAEKQTELQQVQTDFAIQQIEQQKAQAQKDYTKEQKASYVDYMKQTKSNAQNMANTGMSNTGYSESSIISMYNQYQSRVGTAKESLNQTILNYNNGIQQAILSNNEVLAEIAFNSLQTQNQLNQQAFEYKNTMLLQKESALQEVNDIYYARYQDRVSQINSEIELQMALDQIEREYEQWLAEFEEQKKQRQLEQERWEREFSLKQQESNASVAATKAQTSYYQAQTSAINKETNPYNDTTKYNVSTAYYKGDYNKDVKNFGTFSNGYQPKGISGHGYLKKTGQSMTLDTQTLDGKKQTVVQNIWKADDGSLWYWEGRENKYKEYK